MFLLKKGGGTKQFYSIILKTNTAKAKSCAWESRASAPGSYSAEGLGSSSAGKALRWCEPMVCAGNKDPQQLLGCMDSGTACRSKEGIIPWYVTLVRPHLGITSIFGVQHRKDTDKLEEPQWRNPRAPLGLEHLPYEERLGELGWVSLEKGWIWGHLTAPWHIQGVIKEIDMGYSPWCRMGGWRSTGSSWNKRCLDCV